MISLLKFFRIFQKHLFPGGSIECQLMTSRGRGDDTNFGWLWIRGTGVRFFTKFFWSGCSWDNVKKLRNSHRRCSLRKGALRNFTKFTGKHLACNFIKKEALAQEFSCEFWEIFKNNFSYRAPPVAASANTNHHFITQLTFPNFAWYWFTQPVKHRFIICWEIHLFILQSLKGVWSRILPKTLSLKRKSVLCLCKFCLYQYYLHPIILQTWQKKYISDNFEATRHF